MHVHFLSRCFYAPRISRSGTELLSTLLFLTFFGPFSFIFFSDRSTQNQKTYRTINEEKKRGGGGRGGRMLSNARRHFDDSTAGGLASFIFQLKNYNFISFTLASSYCFS